MYRVSGLGHVFPRSGSSVCKRRKRETFTSSSNFNDEYITRYPRHILDINRPEDVTLPRAYQKTRLTRIIGQNCRRAAMLRKHLGARTIGSPIGRGTVARIDCKHRKIQRPSMIADRWDRFITARRLPARRFGTDALRAAVPRSKRHSAALIAADCLVNRRRTVSLPLNAKSRNFTAVLDRRVS